MIDILTLIGVLAIIWFAFFTVLIVLEKIFKDFNKAAFVTFGVFTGALAVLITDLII